MDKIIITIDHFDLEADLKDTQTARKFFKALPFEGKVTLWGEEIYFEIPLILDLEPTAKEEVEVGEIGYWPVGPSFCIFFGRTPVSTGSKPMAYSPVNIFGKIKKDIKKLKTVKNGSKIKIKAVKNEKEKVIVKDTIPVKFVKKETKPVKSSKKETKPVKASIKAVKPVKSEKKILKTVIAPKKKK